MKVNLTFLFYFRSKCWTSKPSGCYEEDLVSNFEENEEELDANPVELANPVANEEQIEELGTNLEEEQIEANQVEVASESGHASITDLLASSEVSSDDEGWIYASDDDDAEAMVEDVDEVMFVDDDEIMVDLVSNSNSQSSAIQDVEENVNFLTAAVLPTVSVASSESSTQGVLDDHLEASELSRNREQFLQSAPVATASTDSAPSLTPLEEHNFRLSIEQTRLRELRREASELQAQVDEQELAGEQHTGYGIVEGSLDYIRDFEGVLPKLPLFSLISNWLSNAENNFNLFI